MLWKEYKLGKLEDIDFSLRYIGRMILRLLFSFFFRVRGGLDDIRCFLILWFL